MANAIYKPVPLELKDGKWIFDPEKLKSTLSSKSKILILNNAHNPTGKLFSRVELE
jgi:aspartate/methionine/tyrosine aminotransferase